MICLINLYVINNPFTKKTTTLIKMTMKLTLHFLTLAPISKGF